LNVPEGFELAFTDIEKNNLNQIALFLRWVHSQLLKLNKKNVKTQSKLVCCSTVALSKVHSAILQCLLRA